MPPHPFVTAHARTVFMIGTPIGQARSPSLFNAYFVDAGIDRVVVPVEVREDGVSDFLRVLRGAPRRGWPALGQ